MIPKRHIMVLLGVILCLTISPSGRTQDVSGPSGGRNIRVLDLIDLTPEQEKDVLDYIRETHPEQYAEVQAIKENRPRLYKRALTRAFREMRFVQRIREEDPERYEQVLEERCLEQQSRELARKYRDADEADREKIKHELIELLHRLFDYRQLNRQSEILRLENRLAELKENLNQRKLEKEKIIENRLNQLIGAEPGLKW